MSFCINCGTQLTDGARFCPYCGKPSYTPEPVGQTPVGQTPVGQTPVGQTPVWQTPVGQTPVGQTPVGQTSVGQIYADQTSPQQFFNLPTAPQFPSEKQEAHASHDAQLPEYTSDCKYNYTSASSSTTLLKPSSNSKKSKKPIIIISTMILLLAIAAVLLFPVIFPAQTNAFSGKWELTSIVKNGKTYSTEFFDILGISFGLLVINDDGTGSIALGGESENITWELKEPKSITLIYNDENIEAVLVNEILFFKLNDSSLYFEKSRMPAVTDQTLSVKNSARVSSAFIGALEGTWKCVQYSLSGAQPADASNIFNEGCTLIFVENGSLKIEVEGYSENARWIRSGDEINVTESTLFSHGFTCSESGISGKYADLDVLLIFEKQN